jgi:hypothetical protein
MPKNPKKTPRKGKPMAKEHENRPRESHRDHEGHEHREHGRNEPYDDPAEHLEIENLRFTGGLPPTPELYAQAREQWYRLPGSIVRPSMDPVIGDGDSDSGQQGTPKKK